MAEESEAKDKQTHLYKVVVIGDYAVGKSSIIKTYCEGVFTPNYKLTIGVDFAVKVVNWSEDIDVHLQLWDVAGHERFGSMTSVYYKYAIAAIIVFDLSRPQTFEAVTKWQEDVNSKVMLANGDPIPAILLANKSDLPGITIPDDVLDKFCKEHGFLGWFSTSAANNLNIDEAMKFLIQNILEISKTNAVARPENTIELGTTNEIENVNNNNNNNNNSRNQAFGAQGQGTRSQSQGSAPKTDSGCCN